MIKRIFPKTRLSQLRRKVAELEQQVTKDPLTGLLNRRGFDEAIEPLAAAVKVYLKNPDHPQRQSVIIRALSLLMIDIDHFKKINDAHGHPAGDIALKAIAQTLSQNT